MDPIEIYNQLKIPIGDDTAKSLLRYISEIRDGLATKEDVVSIRGELAEMKQKSSQAEDKMSHVGREISLLTGKVSHVENEVSLLTGKVTHVENELSHLSVTVTHLADTVTHLEGKVTVVERKVDDLGENLTNFRLEVKDEIWKLKIYLILLAVLMLITNPTVLELVTKLIGIFK